MAFGRLEDLDNRKWFSRREILNAVHPLMYRLKHFGDDTIRASAEALSNCLEPNAWVGSIFPTGDKSIKSPQMCGPKRVVRVTTCLLCYWRRRAAAANAAKVK